MPGSASNLALKLVIGLDKAQKVSPETCETQPFTSFLVYTRTLLKSQVDQGVHIFFLDSVEYSQTKL